MSAQEVFTSLSQEKKQNNTKEYNIGDRDAIQ